MKTLEVWSAGGGAGASACGSGGMDLKHEVAYRGLPSQVKAEPGVSHNGHQVNGHVRDWMAGGAGGGSPSPGAATQPPNNGYSSPLSSSSYGPYSPNGKIGLDLRPTFRDIPEKHGEVTGGRSGAVM
ncbi:unnamed protein product [Diatraea saccharalis]|uniref:Uncharacterized protein n=1 Tax=Diatraea saccharalis TaxID=40085 RepID=A0A9N9QV33_9NEOP|nr:unnamed protein product [Diatraea saccharalis]